MTPLWKIVFFIVLVLVALVWNMLCLEGAFFRKNCTFAPKTTFFAKISQKYHASACYLKKFCAMLGAMKKFLSHIQSYLLASVTFFCSLSPLLSPTINSSLPAQVVPDASNLLPSSDSSESSSDGSDSDGESRPEVDDKADPSTFQSPLIIKALHPGYDDDINSNVGEFIELLNLTDDPLELAGYSLTYTGSGSPSPVFTFPDGSYLVGKHLLMRYERSPEKNADLTYKTGTQGLAKNGKLELSYRGELVDTVCWGTKKTGTCTTRTENHLVLQRNLETGILEPVELDNYEFPSINLDIPNLILPEPPDDPAPDDSEGLEEPEKLPAKCLGLEFSELLTYYQDDKSEQFIEFFNPTNADINLDGCKVGFKNKQYDLSGKVSSGGYHAFYQSQQFALTKNPKNPLALTLIDTNGEVLDEITYPNGQKKSTSFAKVFHSDGSESWVITYAITPSAENIYQKFRNCEEGKVINEATGNCVKVTTLKSATKTLKSTMTSLAACPAGKYRNPLTGRCKNIEAASSTLKACAEGYERNPDTNRCRKIKSVAGNDGANYALTPTVKSDKTVFVGIGIVGLIIVVGVIYIILQFRREILRAVRKAHQRLNHICQHLFARKISRHRNQKP